MSPRIDTIQSIGGDREVYIVFPEQTAPHNSYPFSGSAFSANRVSNRLLSNYPPPPQKKGRGSIQDRMQRAST